VPTFLRVLIASTVSCAVFASAVYWQQDAKAPPTADSSPKATSTPKFWKGNLHTHSLWSDGDDFPEMIADWYKQKGYHFLALTEHNRLAEGIRYIPAGGSAVREQAVEKYRKRFGEAWVERRTVNDKPEVRLKPQAEYRSLFEEAGKFLMIPAEEITHSYAKAPVHINAINVRDVIKPLDGKSVEETISVNLRNVNEIRGRTGMNLIAFLNHPNFGWGVRGEEMLLTEQLRFFEVFNGHPGVRNYGDAQHASCERLWDIVLALRLGQHKLPILYGLATDDSHGYHAWGIGKVNPGRGWVMVRAPHLTADAIVSGLEKGDFYSSTGVQLEEFGKVENEYKLTIQGEAGVTYKTEFIATMKDAKLDSQPVFDKDGKEQPVTRIYDADIGRVVSTSTGLTPSYKLTGKELYVRAKVISSKPHPNPYAAGDTEVAWTQPITP
jgi:hypothetical protein